MNLHNLDVFRISSQKMGWLSERQTVLAQNIANSDTPGYKAKDLRLPDFSSMLNYHKVHKNYITIAVSMKNIQIPYGVFSTTKRGSFEKLIEKPSKRYLVNTGLYLINPKISE